MSATEFLVTTLLFVVIGLVWYIVALRLRLRQSEQAREQAEQARATSSRWSAELEQQHRAQLQSCNKSRRRRSGSCSVSTQCSWRPCKKLSALANRSVS